MEPLARRIGLEGRLLLGLAVLVFLAIGSAGWLTVSAARGGLEGVEEARARGLGVAAAGLIERRDGERDRVAWTANSLLGLGGITDVTVVDAAGEVRFGDPLPDSDLALVRGGGAPLSRRKGDVLYAYAPLHGVGGARAGAVRVAVAVGANLDEAVGGSTRLLGLVTLLDGTLILLFGALFVRSVVGPLRAASAAARRVAAGDLDAPPLAGAAAEIGELVAAFNRMTAALRAERAQLAASREQVLAQEKLATVGRLAAGVAHEIGNPLTAVIGYVELLLGDEPPDGARRDLLARVHRETTRIQHIVHELLDYARPVDDGIEPVALHEVVAAALSLSQPQPRCKGIAFTAALDDGLPLVAASSRRLLQVVLNLLLNAADAMAGDGSVTLRGWRAGDEVVLEVADSGPGVAEPERSRIFDPFFTTKDPGQGTGLGLAVCRSIVQAYAGRIELVPSLRGACFQVALKVWR